MTFMTLHRGISGKETSLYPRLDLHSLPQLKKLFPRFSMVTIRRKQTHSTFIGINISVIILLSLVMMFT